MMSSFARYCRNFIFFFTWLSLALLSVAEIDCELKKNKLASHYELSAKARNGINFKRGQSVNSFQAMECSCREATETFDDDLVRDWDLDLEQDWVDSAVLLVKNCEELAVDLGSSSSGIASELEGAVFILQNIEVLIIDDFAPEAEGGGSDKDEGTFTSFYFRNVTFSELPTNGFDFSEKVEIWMDEVRTDVAVSVNVFNGVTGRTPAVRIENSRFTRPDEDYTDGVGIDTGFQLEVRNEQFKALPGGDQDCYLEYQVDIHIKNNVFGDLGEGDITIEGANLLEISDNQFPTATEMAIKASNVKTFNMANNFVGFSTSQPMVQLEYEAFTGLDDCNEEDLKEDDVRISFFGNYFYSLKESPIEILADSDYSENFVRNKLQAAHNGILGNCECRQESGSNNDPALEKVTKNSTCTKMIMGERVTVSKEDICNGDGYPPEEEIRDGDWKIPVLIAVIVTAIVTAIVVGVIVRLCCPGGGSGVSPRDP